MSQLTYDNIFESFIESPAEAADMKFRADLISVLRDMFKAKEWQQADIMAALNIPQPRASELMRGKADRFSSDKLIGFLAILGFIFKPRFIETANHQPNITCEVHSPEQAA